MVQGQKDTSSHQQNGAMSLQHTNPEPRSEGCLRDWGAGLDALRIKTHRLPPLSYPSEVRKVVDKGCGSRIYVSVGADTEKVRQRCFMSSGGSLPDNNTSKIRVCFNETICQSVKPELKEIVKRV